MNECPKCGADVFDGASDCPKCGALFDSTGRLVVAKRQSTSASVPTRAEPERERTSSGQWSAPLSLRIAYAVALLAMVLPVGLAASGWVRMTTGGSPFLIVPYIGPLLLLALAVYRAVVVVRWPNTLACPRASGFASLLRPVGIVGIFIGALVGLVNVLSIPLTKLIFARPSGTGVEFYVVGVYLSMVGGVGLLGLVCFELSRLRAFEAR